MCDGPQTDLHATSRQHFEHLDVAVDVRPESPTYGNQVMVQPSADNRRALFLPPFVAHGLQTLADNTEVFYQFSGPYQSGAEQGFRWNERDFGIEWPLPISVISDKDVNWTLLRPVDRLTGARHETSVRVPRGRAAS